MLHLAELNLCIDAQLQENPLLEIDEERLKHQDQPKDELQKILDYAMHSHHSQIQDASFDDEQVDERPLRMVSTLEDELLQQLHIELSDPLEIAIGEYIIGSLNEDGYLTTSCEDINRALGVHDLLRVEYILKIIQNFEPLGIASRTLEECLLAQVHARCNGNRRLIENIIENHLEDLGRKKFKEIAKKLGVMPEAVKDASKAISLFEPKPARNYSPIAANLYIKPDIFITKDEQDQYHIKVNREGNLPLRINTRYQKMLEDKNLSKEEKAFIREKLQNALLFIKSINQRGRTIKQITEYILDKQKDFFEHGHMALVPMTLKDIAEKIERNESTISRAISNKYIDTPRGIYPMKFFFSQGCADNGTGAVASRSIKEEIKELIEAEDKKSPLSDQRIQDHFKRKDMNIARRTISKYRQTLRILPSHLRKN